jgi:hypothetical protein
MGLLAIALGAVLLSGCAGRSDGPTVEAFSESDGVLHINGRGWKGCTRVVVSLPTPWTGSKPTVSDDGSFALRYAHPEVKPYGGVVAATCVEGPKCSEEPPKQESRTDIRIGDARRKR